LIISIHSSISEMTDYRQNNQNYIIVNDDQQDATILAYLFIPNQLHVFRAMSSPIIRSTWLYLQILILSTDIAAGWCHGWDGTPLLLHLVGCLYYLYFIIFFWRLLNNLNSFLYRLSCIS